MLFSIRYCYSTNFICGVRLVGMLRSGAIQVLRNAMEGGGGGVIRISAD